MMDLNLDFTNPKVAIVNIVIILFIVLATYDGYKKGLFESFFKFIGFIIASIIAFVLKNKLSVLMYTHLPFFKFGGAFRDISALNILVYELIAFFLIFIVAMLVINLIIKMTHIIESVVKIIPLIGFLDRLLGAVVGFVQSFVILYLVVFVFKFGCNMFGFSVEPSLADNVLEIPILNEKFGKSLETFDQIVEIRKNYESTEKEEFNNQVIKLLLDNKIITERNLNILIKNGKIDYEEN